LKIITIYQPNGKIVGCFAIPDVDVDLMTSGYSYIEEKSDPQHQYVNNNQIIDLPEKPAEGYDFDYDSKSWMPNYGFLDVIAKNKRALLLADSDWTDTVSAKLRLGDALYLEWQTYRQALRDITSQSGYPFNVVWPTPPQG
jgi:hypothetical protein